MLLLGARGFQKRVTNQHVIHAEAQIVRHAFGGVNASALAECTTTAQPVTAHRLLHSIYSQTYKVRAIF